METHVAKSILENAYLQGGAILLLVALLVIALICTYKFIVKVLWEENKSLRAQVMSMNERVATMAEASRITNEKTSEALKEQNTTFRDVLALWRNGK